MQAAQGYAINASINVSDRPVTGQGVKGMKSASTGTGRIVYDQAYYVGLLRRKISDVNNESVKLRTEMDQQSRDNTQYVQLEKRYESLVKNKEALEGQLADYNLALDKVGPWKSSWHVFSIIVAIAVPAVDLRYTVDSHIHRSGRRAADGATHVREEQAARTGPG